MHTFVRPRSLAVKCFVPGQRPVSKSMRRKWWSVEPRGRRRASRLDHPGRVNSANTVRWRALEVPESFPNVLLCLGLEWEGHYEMLHAFLVQAKEHPYLARFL